MERVVSLLRSYGGLMVGATLGIVLGLGLFGIALGGLIGFLLNELVRTRIMIRRGRRFLENTASVDIFDRRAKRILCIYGMSAAVTAKGAEEVDSLGIAEIALLKRRISAFVGLEGREEHLFSQIIDTVNRIDLPGLCRSYAAGTEPSDREVLISFLYRIAAGEDSAIGPGRDACIKSVSEELEVDAERFNAIRRAALPVDLEAYAILGVSPDACDEEVRTVYRRLASDFHPDHGFDLEEQQLRTTEEAFVRIQDAYKRIMGERNGRRKNDLREMD